MAEFRDGTSKEVTGFNEVIEWGSDLMDERPYKKRHQRACLLSVSEDASLTIRKSVKSPYPPETDHAGTLVLDFQARILRNKC